MSLYEDLVIETQGAYTRYHQVYAAGGTPYELSTRAALPYPEQTALLVQEIREADCVLVGGASGLSAAGGGDFYYEDNASFRKYFGKYAEKYHLKGAFDGTMRHWDDRREFWGYLATFLPKCAVKPRPSGRGYKAPASLCLLNVLRVRAIEKNNTPHT